MKSSMKVHYNNAFVYVQGHDKTLEKRQPS